MSWLLIPTHTEDGTLPPPEDSDPDDEDMGSDGQLADESDDVFQLSEVGHSDQYWCTSLVMSLV